MYNRLSIKVKEEKKRVARKLQGILAWNPQLLQSFKEEKWIAILLGEKHL